MLPVPGEGTRKKAGCPAIELVKERLALALEGLKRANDILADALAEDEIGVPQWLRDLIVELEAKP